MQNAERFSKRETWELIKTHGLADIVKKHIEVFGKPERVTIKEYVRDRRIEKAYS